MQKSDFNYYLPEELIAQEPINKRDMSRLMILNKTSGDIKHKQFRDIIDYFNKDDCLVLNNTRVIPARLTGKKEDTGGKIEFVLLHRISDDVWEVILKPGRRAKKGSRFVFGDGILKAEITEIIEGGNRLVKFIYDGDFEEILNQVGQIPLPHYITKDLNDTERYQTIYSKHKGSAAAPTAGLHFTTELLYKIAEKGTKIVYITLHVGLGTFRPVKVDDIKEHKMHSEYYIINKETADIINSCRKKGGKITAVGTTTCRTLETVSDVNGFVDEADGWTDIFIYPGYRFKAVDALITNFHLPESTLIMLVSAFANREFILKAYSEAIKERYRFFSFGDAMYIY